MVTLVFGGVSLLDRILRPLQEKNDGERAWPVVPHATPINKNLIHILGPLTLATLPARSTVALVERIRVGLWVQRLGFRAEA